LVRTGIDKQIRALPVDAGRHDHFV
jgi:hypothetical protein